MCRPDCAVLEQVLNMPFQAWLILVKICPSAAAGMFKFLNPFVCFKKIITAEIENLVGATASYRVENE